MSWSEVGSWIKKNGGTGAALVGSLLTGNVPGAIASGVSLVASATGTDDPMQALQTLQQDPQTLIRLKELAYQNEADIRAHIKAMAQIELETFAEGQKTIRSGDNAQDRLIRLVRPLHSTVSLCAGIWYVNATTSPDLAILGAFLSLPAAYFGLREIGKFNSLKFKK